MNIKRLRRGKQQTLSILLGLMLFASYLYAEPNVPEYPQGGDQVIWVRPLSVFERLCIMAQMPLIHYCVVGFTYCTVIFWPFDWPNGIVQIKQFIWAETINPQTPNDDPEELDE